MAGTASCQTYPFFLLLVNRSWSLSVALSELIWKMAFPASLAASCGCVTQLRCTGSFCALAQNPGLLCFLLTSLFSLLLFFPSLPPVYLFTHLLRENLLGSLGYPQICDPLASASRMLALQIMHQHTQLGKPYKGGRNIWEEVCLVLLSGMRVCCLEIEKLLCDYENQVTLLGNLEFWATYDFLDSLPLCFWVITKTKALEDIKLDYTSLTCR